MTVISYVWESYCLSLISMIESRRFRGGDLPCGRCPLCSEELLSIIDLYGRIMEPERW